MSDHNVGSFNPVHLCARCFQRHKKPGECDRDHQPGLSLQGPCGDHAWHDEHDESVIESTGELVGMCVPKRHE